MCELKKNQFAKFLLQRSRGAEIARDDIRLVLDIIYSGEERFPDI